MRSKPASEKSRENGETGDVPEPAGPHTDVAAAPAATTSGTAEPPSGDLAVEGASDPRAEKSGDLPAAKVVRDKQRSKAGGPDKPGSADKPVSAGKSGAEKPRPRGGQLAIDLEVSRRRSIAWTTLGLIIGGLLIWKLGTVGVWGGIALVAMGAYHAWNLAQTFLYPAGTIVVSDREVSLPRGLCMSRPVVAKPEEVTAVYFLRRSVPWNHASPVLIVELGGKAMAFPRDWFASEADQRQVIHALLRDTAAPAPAEAK